MGATRREIVPLARSISFWHLPVRVVPYAGRADLGRLAAQHSPGIRSSSDRFRKHHRKHGHRLGIVDGLDDLLPERPRVAEVLGICSLER